MKRNSITGESAKSSSKIGEEVYLTVGSGESTEQQIQRQLRESNFQNQLSEIVGQWPGDEDFDDLLKLLTR